MRHALTGVAVALRLDARTVDSVRLAVTEACTNVVRHAYAGMPGSLDVVVDTTDRDLIVEVRDRGPGIRPAGRSQSLGLGLPLIAALSDALRITRDGGGNVVSMTFRCVRPRPARPAV